MGLPTRLLEACAAARELGTLRHAPGLWLPLNGHLLNTSWGAAQGWERSDHRKRYYCLAGPNYNSALRHQLRQLLGEGNLAFFKHDFNFLDCSCPGHGHLNSAVHGREANVQAQLELLAFERAAKPDLRLAVTSNVWPSPWWLMHADSIWMGGADHAEDWRSPVWSRREAEMTYRDTRLYRLLRIDRAQVPVAALMTHGLIRGRYAGIDPQETLQEWTDYVMMFFGRGTQLCELYLSPELMLTTIENS